MKVAYITRQYVLTSTIEAVNIKYSIAFVNYSHLIDTNNVLNPCRVHARDGFSELFIH